MPDETTTSSETYVCRFGPPADDTEAFEAALDRRSDVAATDAASSIVEGVPIYSAPDLRRTFNSNHGTGELLNEWAEILRTGAGVFIVEQAFTDHNVVDKTTAVFNQIIEQERQQNLGADHFAKPGTNDRIWNAFEKLGQADPEAFARYYANDIIALASEAWLGPNYQMTSQVNVVRPGGTAQQAHRDYHLGFQTAAEAARYPRHVHELSMTLTLQAGIAHCDIPVESGPTRLLPFSQRYGPGYLTYRMESYQRVFEQRYVSLPLSKGDALFFNPGLYHAAGSNKTADCNRMVNLLQVSSAFGKPMETVDRVRLCRELYPCLVDLTASDQLSTLEAQRAVRCAADGYPFPTNLDADPPIGGLAPITQADLVLDALDRRLPPDEFYTLLDEQSNRRR